MKSPIKQIMTVISNCSLIPSNRLPLSSTDLTFLPGAALCQENNNLQIKIKESNSFILKSYSALKIILVGSINDI